MKTIRTVGAATLIALCTATSVSGCSVDSPPALTLTLTATSNEAAPSTAALIEILTEHAATALISEDGMVTVVTPDTITAVDLTPMRGDAVEAGMGRKDEKIHDNLEHLEQVVSSTGSTAGGLDLLGALDRGLEATPTGGHLFALTSGYSTVDPVDLNAAGHWIAAPEAFVAAVDAKDLPDATGKRVTFLGLGYPAAGSPQATAGPAARAALQTVAVGLCERMNAVSCDVMSGPVSDLPPVSTTPVPIVELNQLRTACVGQIDIDTSIAFAPESAVLQSNIDSELSPIARSLALCPDGTVVHAVGHSAAVPDPSWGGGAGLEERRAQAILDRLRYLGAPVGAIGTASSGGQIIDNMPGGTYREDLAVRNRTVTLTVTR